MVVPQLAREALALVLLSQLVVGEAAEEPAAPLGVPRTVVVARIDDGRVAERRIGAELVAGRRRVGRDAQQRQRLGVLCLVDVLGHPLAGPPDRVGIDPHPAMAGVQERRPGRLGAGQLGLGDHGGALRVGHRERPLHDGVAVEATRPVARRSRRGLSPDRHPRPHEVLGPDQVDADPGEGVGCQIEELGRRFDIELDVAGLLRVAERPEDVDDVGGVDGERPDGLVEQRKVTLVAGDVDRQRRALPHVGRRAPLPAVGLVDHLEHDRPRVEPVVRHDEPEPRRDHRSAGRPPAGAIERGGDPAERVVLARLGHRHASVEARQRPERRLQHRGGRCAVAGDRRGPTSIDETTAGQRVGEGREDVHRRVGRLVEHRDRRHRLVERGHRVEDHRTERWLPHGFGERSVRRLDDGRRHRPGADDTGGDPGDRREPAHRIARRRTGHRPRAHVGTGEPLRRAEPVEAHRHRPHRLASRGADGDRRRARSSSSGAPPTAPCGWRGTGPATASS